MKIVCDTSVLIAFDALKKTGILKDIFVRVLIPKGVYDELTSDHAGFSLENWIEVKSIADNNLYNSMRTMIDKGESEAISLALEEEADFVLLDDKEARKVASNMNLKVIGTVGLLLSAKRKGLIASVRENIRMLEDRINFRLSTDLKDFIFKEAGE